MTSKAKIATKSESQKEHYFKVAGTCKRGKGGKLHCNLEPVEDDSTDIEDSPEQEESTVEMVEDDEGLDSTDDTDPEED